MNEENPFEGLKEVVKSDSDYYHEQITVNRIMSAIKAAATSGKYSVRVSADLLRDYGIEDKLRDAGFSTKFFSKEERIISWK
ncbi:hypothetical protein [Listeria fleischmannii]|uniref:Uncharacterized protein n=1 Tax=Listeria fleischmannii FSL S10-1203 TaxID=1265822 RepID=W7D7G5_9LIST|nr:hypothetical protein [Listeria fleischmannii]EUJ47988.1 hypothetical protein MCOL2_17732 [Listeria fleischmannii FSL S10-1203]